MTHAPWDPDGAPPSELAFAQVREDVDVELALATSTAQRLGRPVRVLMVASGGCSALPLLAHPWVASVDAVDLNPAQLHLVALREAAMRHLPLPEAWLAQGIEPDAPPEARLVAYAQLRPHLPEATLAHWDARPAQVAFGLHRVGRYEALFRSLAADLRAAGLPLDAPPGGAEAQAAWAAAFAKAFDQAKLAATFGEAAVAFSMQKPFAEHFSGAFRRALGLWAPDENPYLHQLLHDRYAPGQALPYLQASGQAGLKASKPGKLRLHEGDFATRLPDLAERFGPFDVIHTSNLSDWLPTQGLGEFTKQVRRAMARGGSFVGRRLNGDHSLAEVVGEHLALDGVGMKAWQARDRSFFYSELVLAQRAGASA